MEFSTNHIEHKEERTFSHSSSALTGWLGYFAAAVGVCGGGVLAQEQVILNYWSVLPQEEAAAQVSHADIRNNAAIKEACVARLQALRSEALRVAKQYVAAGMTPEAAYEKAWTKTSNAFKVKENTQREKLARLKGIIARMDAEGSRFTLSAEETQWLLAALLENNDGLEGDASSRLLMNLAQKLSANGYGKQGASDAFQDALMQNFADSMRYGQDSMAAYREALFKMNRGNIVNHPLVGYLAPWGMGVHSRNQYRQAPKQYSTTLGSGDSSAVASPVVIPLAAVTSTQPVTQTSVPELTPDFTAGMDKAAGRVENFLASAPNLPVSPQETKEEELDETLYEEEEEWTESPMPGLFSMRSFAMRSAAPVTLAAAEPAPELTWTGSGSTTWVAGNSASSSAWQNGAIFQNGYEVVFGDTSTSSTRNVSISGIVAPGLITVNATNDIASSGGTASHTLAGILEGLNIQGSVGKVNAYVQYGYAFLAADSSACIADVKDAQGNIITPTRIVNQGGSTLVLNTANSFTGGVEVENGALYLGCVNAAGKGAITLHGDSTWNRFENTNSSSTHKTITGAELIINYNSSNASYKTPSISNSIIVAGTKAENNQVRVSFGTGSYGETRLPAESRYVSLNGGVFGTGNLYLYGYTYSADSEYNYVSSFAINKSGLNESYLPSDAPESFTGTVYLRNEFNSASASGRNWLPGALVGGAVQLVLADDVFADATINMTREQTTKTVGWYGKGGSVYGTSEQNVAQTSDNILVISGSTELKGLEADFLGSAWRHDSTRYAIFFTVTSTVFDEKCSQDLERWRVRVVTNSATTLTLNDSDDTHVFSGAMGFAQSYIQAGQEYINEYTGSSSDASFSAGGGTLGVESLSLIKQGSSSQYIHSAKLNTLSLQQGKIGFNNLSLSGYLNLTSGTTLQLGVTSSTVAEAKGWTTSTSSDSVSIQSGKELLIIAAADGNKNEIVNVQGSITMNRGSDIMFSVLRPELGTSAGTALLQLTGSLTLGADIPINVNFTSVEFAKSSAGKTYYLISADKGITINGKDASNFQTRYIPLGNGYYGILNTQNSTSVDYLVMTVSGDPRRTWSGNVGDKSTRKGVWTAATTDAIDYTWKENHNFMNGEVVLFGNLYQPTAWSDGEWGASSTNTTIVGDVQHPGTTGTVSIDGTRHSDFQLVEIQGEVRPVSVAINADYLRHDVEVEDDTNYYFYGSGSIGDAVNSEIKLPNFVQGTEAWQTYLRKGGTGTAVIATANTFSGGSVIEGGRLVMQHKDALGTGGITIQNGAILQGDFADASRSGSAYMGEGMDTTTITNPVYVAIFINSDGTISSSDVDGRLSVAHDKKLVLSELSGGAETVLTLYGNSAVPSATGEFTYSVFKVLDPGSFYGTVKMDGNLMGQTGDGGNVQMEIMTTTKATDGGNWLNATVDLGVQNGTNRTVLALDALGTTNSVSAQVAQIAALQGKSADGSRINSSVLSMSPSKSITLEIIGTKNGDYDGVLGFGDFQKTVDYNATQTGIGLVQHHYGRAGEGELNVNKLGSSVQFVNSAWLNRLEVGKVSGNIAGGRFIVDEALVVNSLQSADGSHISVGVGVSDSAYALAIGQGGILAIDNDGSTDAFAGLGAGIPKSYTVEPSGQNGETTTVEVAPAAFIYLADGATISAFGDWKTNRSRTESINGASVSLEVGIDIATGAIVTFNTHNYTPDEYITASNDVFGRYNSSHAIQLLGEMKGSSVNLIFNNELISAAAVKDGSATKRANGLGYDGTTGTQMGYVAIRDIHQFTGDITVEGMTALQVQNTNSTANSGSADMDITVQGANAALQFLDGVTDQYINNLVLENGGMLLLGGTLKSTTGGITKVDETQVELKIQNLEGKQASLDNLDLVKTSSSKTIRLGGSSSDRTEVKNAQISTLDTAENYDTMELQNVNLQNSVVSLHESCSLDLTTAVLVDKNSKVKGSISTAELQPAALAAVQSLDKLTTELTSATETVTVGSNTTVELTTSGRTVCTASDGTKILHVYADQFQDVNVTGTGLTLILADNLWAQAYSMGMEFVAIQVGGTTGRFLFENPNNSGNGAIGGKSGFTLTDSRGRNLNEDWVTSTFVTGNVGSLVSDNLLWIRTPEPTTTTLSLLALTALATRRRRK